MIRMPIISPTAGMIRPNTPTLTLWFSGMPCSKAFWITKGSNEMCVTECFSMTSQKRLAENFGCSTTVPPTPRVVQIAQLCVFTWKNGSDAR